MPGSFSCGARDKESEVKSKKKAVIFFSFLFFQARPRQTRH